MSNRSLVVLADAAAVTGVGHHVRCAALASELAARGCRVWVTRQPDTLPWVVDDVRSRGWGQIELDAVHDLVALTTAAADLPGLPILLVDSYRVDAMWLADAWQHFPGPVVVVDDVGDRRLHADLVLNQNIGAEQLMLHRNPEAVVLRGPRYALLRHEIASRRLEGLASEIPEQPRRVLVVMGGTDPTSSAPLVAMAAERALPSATVIVVAPDGAVPARGRLRSVPRVHDMAEEMLRSDLVITAAGSTLWEAFCLGRPVAAVQVAANQANVYSHLVEAGVVIGLGLAPLDAQGVVDRLGAGLSRLDALRHFADEGAKMVDGRGSQRVADEVEHVTERWSDARGRNGVSNEDSERG